MSLAATGGSVLDEDIIRRYNRDLIGRTSQIEISSPDSHDLSWWQTLLSDIITTVEQVRLSKQHRAAACDALSGLLKYGVQSPRAEWSSYCSSPALWKRILSLYFDRSNDATSKPLKQVADVLMHILHFQRSQTPLIFRQCSEHAMELCVMTLMDESASETCRPALMILERLVNDKFLTRAQIVAAVPEHSSVSFSDQPLDTKEEIFVYCILLWARNPDLARVCGKFLAAFCAPGTRARQDEETEAQGNSAGSCWFLPLKNVLKRHPDIITNLESHVLPDILLVDKASGVNFARDLPLQSLWEGNTAAVSDIDIRLCLMLLRVDQELQYSLLEERKHTADQSSLRHGVEGATYEEQILFNLLTHRESEIKLAALLILTTQRSTTAPLSAAVARYLNQTIVEFFGETEAKARQNYMSLLKRLFFRLEAIAWRLDKLGIKPLKIYDQAFWDRATARDMTDTSIVLLANVSLLQTYEKLVTEELKPTAAFARHFLALKTLSHLRSLKLPPGFAEIIQASRQNQLHLLLDLTVDPYDDVRAIAADLVGRNKPDAFTLEIAVTNAERLMRASGRADHADGFGRLMSVRETLNATRSATAASTADEQVSMRACHFRSSLFRQLSIIEEQIGSAETDLRGAIADAPLHGNVIAARYMIIAATDIKEVWRGNPGSRVHESQTAPSLESAAEFCRRILDISERIWRLVIPILCDDSPEGTDFFGAEEGDVVVEVGIKDTLSYAWRALKESSFLTQAFLTMFESSDQIVAADLQAFGALIFAQLAQLRHRGAFSAVAQTFALFVATCSRHGNEGGNNVIASLYTQTLDCVLEKGNALTRRSAGLPALICGLLSADPGGALTITALQDLKDVSQRPADNENAVGLPQVHALNCLKDIFMSSRLGPATDTHLSEVLGIAISCLDNDIWAIRNSGLMLLKSLLIRLENGRLNSNVIYQTSSRGVFSKSAYAKHPTLLSVVLRLLKSAADVDSSKGSEEKQTRLIEKTFPAIEIIERVGVPVDMKVEVKALLTQHLSSPVWAMRKKAAVCLAILADVEEVIENLAAAIKRQASQNDLSGALLLVRHYFRDKTQDDEASKFLQFSNENLETLMLACSSPQNEELLFDILTICLNLHTQLQTVLKDSSDRLSSEHIRPFEISDKSMDVITASISDGAFIGSKIRFFVTIVTMQAESQLVLEDVMLNDPMYFNHVVEGLLQSRQTVQSSDLKILLGKSLQIKSSKNPESVALLVRLVRETYLPVATEQACVDKALNDEIVRFCRDAVLAAPNRGILDEAVKLWAVCTGVHLRMGGESGSELLLQNWFALMKSTMAEDMDFEIRLAGLASIDLFQAVIDRTKHLQQYTDQLLPLLTFIYDGLVDDDEDVRARAADLSSWWLPFLRSQDPLTPGSSQIETTFSAPAARRELLGLLPRIYSDSQNLSEYSLRRVLGSSPTETLTISFSRRLGLAIQKSITLFDEEKQNQYVDEVLECIDWAAVLSSGGPSKTDATTLDALSAWCLEGITYLVSRTGSQDNGSFTAPLGTLSQPDAYLLCRRLLVLTRWLTKTEADFNVVEQLRAAYQDLLETSMNSQQSQPYPECDFDVLRLGTLALWPLEAASGHG